MISLEQKISELKTKKDELQREIGVAISLAMLGTSAAGLWNLLTLKYDPAGWTVHETLPLIGFAASGVELLSSVGLAYCVLTRARNVSSINKALREESALLELARPSGYQTEANR